LATSSTQQLFCIEHCCTAHCLGRQTVAALVSRFRGLHTHHSVMTLSCAYLAGPLDFDITRFDCIMAKHNVIHKTRSTLEMWANAQCDGRPAECRWRPLFNAAGWLTPTTRVPYSNAAKTRNPLKLAGVPHTNETISAASGPKFTILWVHVEGILLLNKFFSNCRYVP